MLLRGRRRAFVAVVPDGDVRRFVRAFVAGVFLDMWASLYGLARRAALPSGSRISRDVRLIGEASRGASNTPGGRFYFFDGGFLSTPFC